MNLFHTISYTSITNKRFHNFFTEVTTAIESVEIPEIQNELVTQKKAIKDFLLYTTSVSVIDAKKETTRVGTKRTEAFHNFLNMVKVQRNSTNQARAVIAEEAWKYIKDFHYSATCSQKVLGPVIDSVQENFGSYISQEENAKAIAGTELENRYNDLIQVHKEYTVANQNRAQEREIREQDNNKDLRDACIASFQRICTQLEYNATIKGDADCLALIGKINAFIDSTTSFYTSKRRSSNQKKIKKEQTAVQAEKTA